GGMHRRVRRRTDLEFRSFSLFEPSRVLPRSHKTRGGKSNRNSKAAGPESGTLCTSTTLVSGGVEFLATGKRHQRLGGDGANPVRRDARLAPAGLAARRH